MNKWLEFDDNMIYNEDTKQVIHWTTYGDNDEYFLSEEYEYDVDFLEPIDNTDCVLVNELINDNNTLETLIKRTKSMFI